MPMQVPEERVYYYEPRECGQVLLCWIPRTELDDLVRDHGVDASITEDHPDGLDIEVTPSDIGYHAKRYNLDLGVPPEDLLLAFEAIDRSKEVDAVGEIKGAVVEALARSTQEEESLVWDVRRPVSGQQAQVVLESNPAVQMRIDRDLRRLTEDAPRTRSVGKRKGKRKGRGAIHALQDIRRSQGEAPMAVFAKLQRRSKQEK